MFKKCWFKGRMGLVSFTCFLYIFHAELGGREMYPSCDFSSDFLLQDMKPQSRYRPGVAQRVLGS